MKSIIASILGIDLTNLKYMDVPVGERVYGIRAGQRADNEEKIYLAAGYSEYVVSERQLAAAYIADSPKVVQGLKFSSELAGVDGVTFLQYKLRDLEERSSMPEEIKLQCIGRLSRLNYDSHVVGEPVYKKFCYFGHSGYQKAMEDLRNEKHDEAYYGSQTFVIRYKTIMRELHASGVTEGMGLEKNEEKVPIFILC